MKTPILAALLTLAASPALADRAAGDACATGLSPEARAIYSATAPDFAASKDPRGLLTTRTRGLVQAGTVPMGKARAAAQAAAACLEKLR